MSKLFKYISIFAILELILCLAISVQVQAAVTITTSASSGKVGDTITVTGSGFTAASGITISYDTTALLTFDLNLTATTFSRSITIPSSISGTHNIIVSGTEVAETATKTFTVVPSIVLSKASGEPGISVTVTGYGYDNLESGITMTMNGSQVGSTSTASALGYWSSSFSVPSVTAGAYTLTAAGANGSSATAPFAVTVIARINANKTSGPAGTSVTVTGTGFSPNESGVIVTLGGKSIGSSTSATSSGTWSLSFSIPVMPGGSYTLDAYGNTTQSSSVGDLSFSVTPTLSISPTSASPGATISVEGTGFGDNESIIIIYDSSDVQSGIKSDSNGSWSNTIKVPAGSSGNHKIYARGTSTAKSPASGVDFKVGAGISINKTSGVAGSIITVTGSGFAAKESGLSIIFGDTKTALTATASDSGSWTANFTIPVSSGGEHLIAAEGKSTAAISIPAVSFTVLPTVSIDKTEGTAGTSVSISANGFMAGESGISITYDGKALGPKISADMNGSWKATVTIPTSSAGQHTLQVNGSITSTVAIGELSFDVTATMSISPVEGFIGSSVNVTGSGFTANSNLRFMFDNTELTVGLVSTDNAGNFNKSITIPKATGGSHVIRVQDSQSHSVEAVFNMDNVAPPVPKVNSPEEGAKIGLFGNITPTFEWAKVTDQSGVTYSLQVSKDEEFGDIIIDANSLTANKYTIKKADALPRGQYFWRVQAVDGASNASAWTDPVTLISGKISPMIFTLIIVAVVVVIGAGLFFLFLMLRKKRNARKPQAAAEIVIPEVVNAEYRQIEGDKKALPWRLALPQAPQPARGSKGSISGEDQARLKVIVDFAKSMPLAEPGANTNWLVDLAENNSGLCASPALYSQLVKGELQLRYEPAWMRHPTYLDLQTLLEGQPILQDLNTFVDSVNNTAAQSQGALQDIYQEVAGEISWDIFTNGGWVYISTIYMDSFNWFQGKYLKEPSERDYSIKPETLASGDKGFGLYAESVTPFAGLLIQVGEEKEALQLRAIHLKLRRNFRNSDRIKTVVAAIIQLEVQRNRLTNAFSQFNRLNPS